jgi:hypothetical protein
MPVPHLRVRIEDQITADQQRLRFNPVMTERQKFELESQRSASTGVAIQQFYIEFKNYYTMQKVSSLCNDITFTNLGSNPVTISGSITLQQNQSLQISGNAYELDTTEYDVRFSVNNSPNNNILVIRKLYK